MRRVGMTFGHYLPWDGYQNALYAQAHGFENPYPKAVEGSIVNYRISITVKPAFMTILNLLNMDLVARRISRAYTFAEGDYGVRRPSVWSICMMADFHGFIWDQFWRKYWKTLAFHWKSSSACVTGLRTKNFFIAMPHGVLIKDKKGNITKIDDSSSICFAVALE